MIPIRPKPSTMEAFATIDADITRIRATLEGQTTDEALARAGQMLMRVSRNANAMVMLTRGEIADAKARERRDGEQRRKAG